MSVTSILNEIVQNLEQSPNLIRIKKVMFCACKGTWENDRNKLHNISVESLVKELYWKTQRIDKLDKIFDKILSKINKKTEYSLVINTISEQVGKLYLEASVAKKENTDIPWLVNSAERMPDNSQSRVKQSMLTPDSRTLFEVRFKLMQHSNPLKVKILIFSAIEREFNFSSQDWLQLRSISLDQLLEQLVQTFPALSDLESHLKKVSSYLDKSDEMLQVALVILESIAPLYKKNNVPQVFNPEDWKSGRQPVADLNRCKTSLEQEIFQHHCVGKAPTSRTIYQSFQHSNLNENETLNLMELESYHQFNSLSHQDLKIDRELEVDSDLISSYSGVTSDFSDSSGQPRQEFSDSLLQVEPEIEKQVNQSVGFAISQMKTLLKDLEIEVESRLQGYPLEVKATMKHQTLKKFISHFQRKVVEFDQILSHPETSEGDVSSNISNFETSVGSNAHNISQSHKQNYMMELAQQGNCQAITTLINQSLNPRGINTFTKIRNSCLHIFLESEPVSTKESTAQFVHKKLIFLKIKSIQSIKIYGRKTGNKAIVWAQEFAYNHL